MQTPDIYSQVITGKESQEALIKGVNIVCDAVKSTLGAAGRTVVLERKPNVPAVTKDGVSVAREIYLQDNAVNMGAQIVKQACARTADVAGDATTTSSVMAQFLVNEGYKLEGNRTLINKGMRIAYEDVCEELEVLSRSIDSVEQVSNIAYTSSNGDEEIANAIAQAYSKVGNNGIIRLGNRVVHTIEIDAYNGVQLRGGMAADSFRTNPNHNEVEFTEAKVLLLDCGISRISMINNILQECYKADLPLLIVSDFFDDRVLNELVQIKHTTGFKIALVKTGEQGDMREGVMDDLAILTGTKVIRNAEAGTIRGFKLASLGSVERVTATRNKTSIIPTKDHEEAVAKRVDWLKEQAEGALLSPYEVDRIKERVAMLTTGIATIECGASSDVETHELRDRLDDAIRAVTSSLEDGYVAGGGSTLTHIQSKLRADDLKGDLGKGYELVRQALSAPFNQILANGDLDASQYELKAYGEGVDVLRQEPCNMLDRGIVDSTLAIKEALKNAISVANTILSSATVITIGSGK